jgi:hypothetical protein
MRRVFTPGEDKSTPDRSSIPVEDVRILEGGTAGAGDRALKGVGASTTNLSVLLFSFPVVDLGDCSSILILDE